MWNEQVACWCDSVQLGLFLNFVLVGLKQSLCEVASTIVDDQWKQKEKGKSKLEWKHHFPQIIYCKDFACPSVRMTMQWRVILLWCWLCAWYFVWIALSLVSLCMYATTTLPHHFLCYWFFFLALIGLYKQLRGLRRKPRMCEEKMRSVLSKATAINVEIMAPVVLVTS